MTVLAKKKSKEIKRIFKILDDNEISKEAIEKCLTVLATGKAKEIEKIFKVLAAHDISKEIIENCLFVLARGKSKEIEGIFKVLDAHSISKEAIEKCLSVLAMGKAKEIEKIFKVLDAHNISKKAIENCLSLFESGESGKAKEIEKIFKVLDAHKISKESIENCLLVLATGKAKEIEGIFKVLDAHDISKEVVENCLYVLARGKAQKIEGIFKVLDAHGISKEAIENCLSVLALGKAKEIESILKVLDAHDISKEVIENCLYLLALGKAKEIEKIFKVLDAHKISKRAIENSLSVLIGKKAERVNEILIVLEKNGIKKEQIEAELTAIVLRNSDIEALFNDDKIPENKDVHFKNIRHYMRLKQMYNKYYTKEEIEAFCARKKITVKEFIERVVLYPNAAHMTHIYLEILAEEGKIYIGGSIPINKEYLYEHEEELLALAQQCAYSFGKQNGITDYDELESHALEIIVNKCGDLVFKLQTKPKILTASMYTKTYKYLYSTFYRENNVSLTLTGDDVDRKEHDIPYTQQYYENNSLSDRIDNKNPGFDEVEAEVMQEMIRLTEAGEDDNLFKKVSIVTGIDIVTIMEIIGRIREKMINNGIVREGARGYEFGD